MFTLCTVAILIVIAMASHSVLRLFTEPAEATKPAPAAASDVAEIILLSDYQHPTTTDTEGSNHHGNQTAA